MKTLLTSYQEKSFPCFALKNGNPVILNKEKNVICESCAKETGLLIALDELQEYQPAILFNSKNKEVCGNCEKEIK